MRRRLFESLGVATAIAAVMVLLQPAAGGQGPRETPWGHPDLEGRFQELREQVRLEVNPE